MARVYQPGLRGARPAPSPAESGWEHAGGAGGHLTTAGPTPGHAWARTGAHLGPHRGHPGQTAFWIQPPIC
jgi:hypothetical protein